MQAVEIEADERVRPRTGARGRATALAPCPWCRQRPGWLTTGQERALPGGTDQDRPVALPPWRALGCTNRDCPVQPHTRWRETAEYRLGKLNPEPGAGCFWPVDHDPEAIEEWNLCAR